MSDGFFLRYLRRFLIAVVLVSIVAWCVVYTLVGAGPKTPHDEMLIELSKSLAQLVFITLAGATATFLYNQYAKDHDRYKTRLQEQYKNRRELLDALINVRAAVEKVRRGYRLIPPDDAREGYRHTVDALLQARLELSQVWHDILTLQQLFGEDSVTIQAGLQGMKVYLDRLIDEYETRAGSLKDLSDPEAAQFIANLEQFGRFVTGDGGQEYTETYLANNYRRSATLIRKHLIDPQGNA